MNRVPITSAAILLLLLAAVTQANPNTFTFHRITNNGNPDVSKQLSVEVIDASDLSQARVTFHFENSIGVQSSITDVYFDDGTLLGASMLVGPESGGVDFRAVDKDKNLPSGETVGFYATQGFVAFAEPPPVKWGIDTATEWLDITFDLLGGNTFAQTLADLQSETPALRIGLHVQAIGTPGGSDSYVNNNKVTPDVFVPVPGAALLGFIGLSLIGWAKRRFA